MIRRTGDPKKVQSTCESSIANYCTSFPIYSRPLKLKMKLSNESYAFYELSEIIDLLD